MWESEREREIERERQTTKPEGGDFNPLKYADSQEDKNLLFLLKKKKLFDLNKTSNFVKN